MIFYEFAKIMPLFNILIFNKFISNVSGAVATYCRKWQRQGKFELTIIDKTLKIEFSYIYY